MENKIKKDVQEEVDKLWESNLKHNFENHLNQCLKDSLNNIEAKIQNLEDSMKKHIEALNQNLEQKFSSQMSQLMQQSNLNDENLVNNDPVETDELLRNIKVELDNITFPPLKNIVPPMDSNLLINLILNCLVNIKTLISYYLNPQKEKKIMKNPNVLGPAFLKLLDHSWKSKFNEYTPNEIHQVLKNIMKKDYYTQNPGLIFSYILSNLNSELSQNELNKNVNIEEDPLLKYRRDKAFESFIKQNKDPVKIANSFYNIIETEKRCETCGSNSYSFAYLPLINIYLQANPDNIDNNISFIQHFKILLTDVTEEKIKENCDICTCVKEKFVSKLILDTNDVIIVNINRNNDPNNMVEFNFPAILDKDDIIDKTKNHVYHKMKYEILCVIKKYKVNNNDFFLLFCKNFINNEWYAYNNNKIRKTDFNEVNSDNKTTCLIIYYKQK